MKPRRGICRPILIVIAAGLFTACLPANASPGDMNDDGEVSLPDLVDFADCLAGPNSGNIDPTCLAGDFDADDRIDLYDVSAFQRRFGFGVGPPRIDRFWPPPGDWVVDDIGLTHVEVGFTEPVIVPREAIIVWLVSGGIGNDEVSAFQHSYDTQNHVLTIAFDPPLRDDRYTLILDYTIEDQSGRPLDGEIDDPYYASLPSGDGVDGGQAVFRINVLQGDANRDGAVDGADVDIVSDSLGLCESHVGFDSEADLNQDGCITSQDAIIVSSAMGQELPTTDGTSPTIIRMYAGGAFGSFEELWIDFDEIIIVHGNPLHLCYLTQADGTVLLPTQVGQGGFGFALKFVFLPASAHCNLYKINVSNALSDLSGELLVPHSPCTCLVDCPTDGVSP